MITTSEQIKQRLSEMCSHLTFRYLGKDCGVDPINRNCFEMWCGDQNHTATSISEVIDIPFFSEKSISEICDQIEIIDW